MNRPRCATLKLDQGCCIEVYGTAYPHSGALLGYAILFGGFWDGWKACNGTTMRKVAIGVDTAEEAVNLIMDEWRTFAS